MTYEQWKEARKDIKRRFSACSWAILIYQWITTLTMVAQIVVQTVGKLLGGLISDDFVSIETAVMESAESAWGYFLAAAIGFVLLLIWKKPYFLKEEVFAKGKPMNFGSFFAVLSLMISGQFVYLIGSTALECTLNCFGYSIAKGVEMLQTDPNNVSMVLYAGLLAPVTEELLFRGLVQRSLLPFGKKFAILFSALTFGLFHGNLLQTPYAFAVGLVLGYVALEYNIIWAMVLHLINNLVLGDLLYRLMGGLPEQMAALIIWGIVMAFTLAAVIVLIAKRGEIAAWLRSNKIIGAYVECYFSSFGTIVMLLVMAINTVMVTFEMVLPL